MQRLLKEIKGRFKKFGYQEFKVNLFENYDYYFQNRELIDETNILKVIHPSGHLYGLQADITTSAIKAFVNQNKKISMSQKYYYDANTYESSPASSLGIKTNRVIGVEWFGVNDIYADVETILLANTTLANLQQQYVLELSHINILRSIIETLNINEEARKEITKKIISKNIDGLSKLLDELKVDDNPKKALLEISGIRGRFKDVLVKLEKYLINDKLKECYNYLKELEEYLDKQNLLNSIYLDLSMINKQNYYSGIIIQGFVKNIHKAVLRGGRYQYLKDYKNNYEAIGFSIELDELLTKARKFKTKVDYLVVYEKPDVLLYDFIKKIQDDNLSVVAINQEQLITKDENELKELYENIYYYKGSVENVS